MKKSRKIFISAICILLAVLFVLSITVMVFSSAMSVKAYAASSGEIQDEINSLNSKKSSIEGKIDGLQTQISSMDYQKSSVLEKKKVLDQKNELAQQELDVIQEQITIVDNLMSNQQKDLANAKQKEATERDLFLKRVRVMEENSTLSYLQVLFNATNFSDLLTRIDLVNNVMDSDKNIIADYKAAQQNVAYLESQSEQMQTTNKASKTELETKKAELESDINSACQMISDLEDNIQNYNDLMSQEQAAESEVQNELKSKANELANAKAAEAAAAAKAAAAQNNSGNNNSNNNSNSGNNATNTSDTCFLWPSYCTLITSYYGYRIHPVYGYYKFHSGVDIGAAAGTSIWAAASGTVSASTYNSGYGNYVMITHNNGYTTLYGHMTSRAVSYGQSVSQGQVIGYVGSTGVATGPHIHFEVRSTSSGGTLNPMGFSFVYS